MWNRRTGLKMMTGVGAIMGVAIAVTSAGAWATPSRTTYVTFTGPVGLPGVILEKGTYVFELANPTTSMDIVRVLDKSRSRVYFTGLAQPVTRPAEVPTSGSVAFGETPQGVAPAVVIWYPFGESIGYRLLYGRQDSPTAQSAQRSRSKLFSACSAVSALIVVQ